MAEPNGRWKAIYTPGRWVVLSGPTLMVVMPPAAPKHSALINDIWAAVVTSGSVYDLVSTLSRVGVDKLPDFGAFFWGDGQMRTLLRGRVSVRDADTGESLGTGEGIQTWSELGLGDRLRCDVDLDPVEADALQLPLVTGAVTASRVRLDCSDSARLVFTEPTQDSADSSTTAQDAEPVAAPAPAAPIDEAEQVEEVPASEVIEAPEAPDAAESDEAVPDPVPFAASAALVGAAVATAAPALGAAALGDQPADAPVEATRVAESDEAVDEPDAEVAEEPAGPAASELPTRAQEPVAAERYAYAFDRDITNESEAPAEPDETTAGGDVEPDAAEMAGDVASPEEPPADVEPAAEAQSPAEGELITSVPGAADTAPESVDHVPDDLDEPAEAQQANSAEDVEVDSTLFVPGPFSPSGDAGTSSVPTDDRPVLGRWQPDRAEVSPDIADVDTDVPASSGESEDSDAEADDFVVADLDLPSTLLAEPAPPSMEVGFAERQAPDLASFDVEDSQGVATTESLDLDPPTILGPPGGPFAPPPPPAEPSKPVADSVDLSVDSAPHREAAPEPVPPRPSGSANSPAGQPRVVGGPGYMPFMPGQPSSPFSQPSPSYGIPPRDAHVGPGGWPAGPPGFGPPASQRPMQSPPPGYAPPSYGRMPGQTGTPRQHPQTSRAERPSPAPVSPPDMPVSEPSPEPIAYDPVDQGHWQPVAEQPPVQPASPTPPVTSPSGGSAPSPYGPFGGVIASLPSFGGDNAEPEQPVEQQSPPETDGETIFATGIAATHKVGANAGGPRSDLVLAALCNRQHPNPPDAKSCARCGAPVDTTSPQLVNSPVLAVVRASTGQYAELDGVVLVGRAPSAKTSDTGVSLLTVPSPSQDISRTHLRFAAIDWEIVVTDLHSTNGTVMIRPGEQPARMVPGDPVAVGIGTILDLGDGVTIRIDQP